MKCYRVGGCVRDHLLGLPVNDIDWVVTGATRGNRCSTPDTNPSARTSRSSCTPRVKQEYALARSERKTGPGYRGFEISADPATTIEAGFNAP